MFRAKAARGHFFTREKLLKSIERLKAMRDYCDGKATDPKENPKVKQNSREQAEIYTTAIEAMETILYDL